MLQAVERLTRDTYGTVDGPEVAEEMRARGHDLPFEVFKNLTAMLVADDFLTARIEDWGFIDEAPVVRRMQLTTQGRRAVRAGDPFQNVMGTTRAWLDSAGFRAAFPSAFGAWISAEKLLWAPDTTNQLTAIGHHCRDAAQAFATELVEQHQPPDVDLDRTHVERRLGAVIAMYRERLGEARRNWSSCCLCGRRVNTGPPAPVEN
jgi:hypothetical protein